MHGAEAVGQDHGGEAGMKPLVRSSLADRIMESLTKTAEMSWKQHYEATGKPTMSSLSYAVLRLEKAGKVERARVVFAPKYNYKEDRTHAARVLIRRKA